VSVTAPTLAGQQTPRIMLLPEYGSSAGQEAIDLAKLAGLHLDPWEALVLEHSLGEGADGRWAAAEVGLCVPRQNGKNAVLEARELAGLYLLGEDLLIHSAQHFKTAKEHFLRLYGLIESTPELSRRVRKVIRTHGEEGIELHGGQRILFFARTKSAGRGFTAPFVAFDEAMFLAEASIGALLPTMAAMPNRQRWYAGSAVDQEIHNEGIVFARVRERGISGSDSRLAYFEWSADADTPTDLDDATATDPNIWAEANPGMGIRISQEAIEDEWNALDRRTFAVERLGVGDWPSTEPDDQAIISPEQWAALENPNGRITGPICVAFDVAPDRRCSIAVAGRNQDGLWQVEIADNRDGNDWAVGRLNEIDETHEPALLVADGYGPAGALLPALEEAGVKVKSVTAHEYAQSCGMFVDAVQQQAFQHLGSHELASAVKGAAVRPLVDAWAWSRKKSERVDISPLVAATLALWAAMISDSDDDWAIF
jgi:hypothetical protein